MSNVNQCKSDINMLYYFVYVNINIIVVYFEAKIPFYVTLSPIIFFGLEWATLLTTAGRSLG